jgi:hypothetical protein
MDQPRITAFNVVPGPMLAMRRGREQAS